MARNNVRHLFAAKSFVGLTLLMATSATAQYSQNEMLCWGLIPGQPDEQVVACTTVTEAGGDVMKLSNAHCNRGIAFQARGHLDFNEAIAVDQNSASAFLGRGAAYRAKGDLDHAITDYGELVRLNAGDAMAYNDRAIAMAYKRNCDGAIEDFNNAIRLKPTFSRALRTE